MLSDPKLRSQYDSRSVVVGEIESVLVLGLVSGVESVLKIGLESVLSSISVMSRVCVV